MANKSGRRRFGNVRKLPSGRYQARYLGPDGLMRTAPETFERKSDADRYLSLVESQLLRHEWIDPDRSKLLLAAYAVRWVAERPKLRIRTVQLYTWLLKKYVTPYIGSVPLGRLDTPMIREWRARLIADGVSLTMTAKAYRLLRSVLNTAVREDELIRVNPCRVPGADRETPTERPTLTISEVLALGDAVPDRYRALILVATFGCLRWGEVTALRRSDLDAELGAVRVRQAYVEHRGRGLELGPPKSRAGLRAVSLPRSILPIVQRHFDRYVEDDPEALVFCGPTGRPIWRGNFNKLVNWAKAVESIGRPGLHFHDLRHTGNTLAAQTGTSLRDLMARMGHDDPRAALIYQHATREADLQIAKKLNAAIKTQRRTTRDPANKTAADAAKNAPGTDS